MVLDASSSLSTPRLARQTEEYYVDVLERITDILCREERLLVYPMARDRSAPLLVDTVWPTNVSRSRIRQVAHNALQHDPGHSDFWLVVERAREEVLPRAGTRAVFLLTDGSYYPQGTLPANRRLQTVVDRLVELDRLAAQMRQDSLPFYVVGIRADQAKAVDRELDVTWSDSAEWTWPHGAESLDLKKMSGDSLLAELFSWTYVPHDRLNVWELLISRPGAPWQALLDYSSGWTRELSELSAVRMEHLMFVPADSGAGPDACARVRYGPRLSDAPPPEQHVRIRAHRFACSIERPSKTEIDSIAAHGVAAYAFHQPPRYFPANDPAPLYGLNEFILSLDGSPCPEWTLSQAALQGRRPSGSTAGRLEMVALSAARGNDTVRMVKENGSPCIVPDVPENTASERQGDYLLFFRDSAGEWIHPRRFELPRLRLASVDFRPGGFPFPPGRLVLLGVCVHSTAPMDEGEKLFLKFGTSRPHPLENASRDDCPAPPPGSLRLYVYGFRGVILLKSTDVGTALVAIGQEAKSDVIPQRGAWLSISLTPNGTWFLSHWCLFGSVALGALIQMGYLGYFAGVRFRHLRRLNRLLSLSLSVFISAMLVVVFAEFCVMVTQSPIESSSIPIPFALVVFGHALKLLAAALVPELVEDTLLND